MNVLNWSYFDTSRLLTIIDHLKASLKDGGLLITGTNEGRDSLVNGGVYVKNGERFEAILESGEGSPVRRLLLGSS
jgi:chemotaxis methyl-accepting protein methylase